MRRTANFLLLPALIAFASIASLSFAQSERYETGSLTATLNGEESVLRSYFADVPEDVAEGVTDPQQRAILERIAGTEQHTATYTYFDEMKLGTMVLVPAKIHVSLHFAAQELDVSVPGSISVRFSLEPTSLELGAPEDVEITLHSGSGYSDYYALTEGGITLDSVEVVDANTLRITGSFSGTFSHQTGYDRVHNPADTLSASGVFSVERVVGSDLALELIEEQAAP